MRLGALQRLTLRHQRHDLSLGEERGGPENTLDPDLQVLQEGESVRESGFRHFPQGTIPYHSSPNTQVGFPHVADFSRHEEQFRRTGPA